MRFFQAFGLRKKQAELDFVDIELTKDTPLFVDPFALSIRKDDWSYKLHATHSLILPDGYRSDPRK